jgi:anti-sigma B factor antagonist
MNAAHKVSMEMIGTIPILIIEGDMTSEADGDVTRAYMQLKEKGVPKNLVLNFERTNYINSAGIATLINIIQDMGDAGGKIYFVGLSNHFQRVMDIVGISDFVSIFNTDNEALDDIRSKNQA